ncbi:Diphthine synthase [Pseudoloma neurophilia]|uniref:diphthine methyl ester synthase n=1 Tax=Pseudoloma neurophilia TaxID=146866 RepID=A0A0R0M0C4_9MICR|nr:Diphthine synthase [Pseudoloma neurophilia]
MLYLIGLGLADYEDLSLRSVKIIKKADKVYLEAYTCIIHNTLEELKQFFGKEIALADRNLLENTQILVEQAKYQDIVLLVPGTPIFATTHTDLILRCQNDNVTYKIIDNISIFNVIGHFGLFSYNFGRTVSIPFFTDTFKPYSIYDKIKLNIDCNLHTLCLLDIKINRDYYNNQNEFSFDPDNKTKNIFMNANTAIKILMDCEKHTKYNILTENKKIFVICRFGHPTQQIFYDTIQNLLKKDFNGPLHSLIIPGPMEVVEKEHTENFFVQNKK